MPDENGYATPEERGDVFVDPDAKGVTIEGTAEVVPEPKADEGNEPAAADPVDDSNAAGDDGSEGTAAAAADPAAGDAAGTEAAAGSDPAAGDTTEATGEDEAKPADPPPVQQIPKPRFNEKIRQLRSAKDRIAELEKENAELKAGTAPAAAPVDKGPTIEELETQLAENNKAIAGAVKDGDGDKVAELMAAAQLTQRALAQLEIGQATTTSANVQNEQQEFTALKLEVEAEMPFLDPNSDTYDQDQVDNVSTLVQDFQRAGHSAGDALVRAVSLLYPESVESEKSAAAETKPAADPKPVTEAAKKKTNVAKNVAASKASPPDITDNNVGTNSNELGATKQIVVADLTEEEFDALPLSKLKELRGDVL